MHIQYSKEATSHYEYGCDMRRLYPWNNVAEPLWGNAICSVRPGESTTPHDHDEEETFLIQSGLGVITVDGEAAEVEAGDLIYLPRHSTHTIENRSQDQPLEFLTIFWGSPEANERMVQMAQDLTTGAPADK